MVVQRLRLHAPNAGGPGSIPGQGTRSRMHATIKDPSCCNQRSHTLQPKIPHAAAKDPAQPNK